MPQRKKSSRRSPGRGRRSRSYRAQTQSSQLGKLASYALANLRSVIGEEAATDSCMHLYLSSLTATDRGFVYTINMPAIRPSGLIAEPVRKVFGDQYHEYHEVGGQLHITQSIMSSEILKNVQTLLQEISNSFKGVKNANNDPKYEVFSIKSLARTWAGVSMPVYCIINAKSFEREKHTVESSLRQLDRASSSYP